jgi:hypothetical protein
VSARPRRLLPLALVLAWCLPAVLLAGAAPAFAAAAEPAAPGPPVIDPARVVFYADQGRLELEGDRLLGIRLRWEDAKGTGSDVCLDPAAAGARQRCSFSVPRTLPSDARFAWAPALPPGSPAAAGEARTGEAKAPFVPLRPARVILDRVLTAAATAVDLSGGIGRIPLAHPESVAAVDCAQATCELGESAVEVRALAPAASGLTIHVHLAPHHFVLRDDTTESTFSRTLAVLHCPAEIVSGPPVRRADAAQVLVRLGARCGGDPRALHWTANGEPITVTRTEKEGDSVLVLLAVGDIEDATLTVTAARPETEGSVLAVAHTPTRPAPLVRATLEIPGHGAIDFLPSNRDAVLHVAPVGERAHLVPLGEEGAYKVTTGEGGVARVRGEEGIGGYVALRFGYRVDGLPAAFATTDLAVVTESLQRPIREASIPAPIGPSATGPDPLVELVCTDEHGAAQRIVPGKRTSIPFSRRDGCRVIIHRERFKPEDGTQDLMVDVDVTKVDDSPRSDAHVSERMVLRPSAEPRIFWIKGVKAQFDRVTVRMAHVADDDRYVGARDTRTSLPAVQWTLVVGEGRLRFYATAAIPTGLFHITAPSGVLTLNFGALSRLTWLDHEGHEGILGLELGAMGVGLAATTVGNNVPFPPTLAVLAGAGVSIPIGNRGEPTQASVNLHAWAAYELRNDYQYQTSAYGPKLTASHWSFLFGPSITIGNVGTNL